MKVNVMFVESSEIGDDAAVLLSGKFHAVSQRDWYLPAHWHYQHQQPAY